MSDHAVHIASNKMVAKRAAVPKASSRLISPAPSKGSPILHFLTQEKDIFEREQLNKKHTSMTYFFIKLHTLKIKF